MLNGPSTRCQHGFPASLTSNQFSDLLARNTWAVSTLPIGWWWVWVCTPFIYRGFPGIPPYSLVKSSIPSPKRIITRPQVYVHWATYLVSPSIPSWFEDMAIISGTLWYNIYQRYTIRYHRYLQSYILVHWYPRIPRYTKGFPVVHWSSKYQWATLRMPLGTQFQRERPWDHRHSFCWWQKLRRSRWNVVEEVIPKTLEQEIRKCPLKNSEDPLFYLWATIVVYSVLKYQTSLSRFSNLQLSEWFCGIDGRHLQIFQLVTVELEIFDALKFQPQRMCLSLELVEVEMQNKNVLSFLKTEESDFRHFIPGHLLENRVFISPNPGIHLLLI